MSFLDTFWTDLNRTIWIYPLIKEINWIWATIDTRPTVSTSWIKCFLSLKSQKYNQYIENEVEYVKATHQVRLELWNTINIGDKIKDEYNIDYTVKFLSKIPWFDWVDDHLFLLVEIVT